MLAVCQTPAISPQLAADPAAMRPIPADIRPTVKLAAPIQMS
ncbi:MAG: hypothetical protein QOI26_1667, partial [Pseudonocardiales bacterium]|nr:hypothetical protein [Pseudonocardiales bacterium]